MKQTFLYTITLLLVTGCQNNKNEHDSADFMSEIKTIRDHAQNVRNYVRLNAVIAHRGTTYWAPEETEAAFRWARNMGADYLELDLQMTKDSVLIALHDNDLRRTTNVADIFPERAKSSSLDFTLQELRSLDAGSWFNIANPDRARDGFANLNILTFKDVVMIAEGYRIKREHGEPVKALIDSEWAGHYQHEIDPHENGHRPGIYAETKKPEFEKLLAKELTDLGWNINSSPKDIITKSGKVGIANTNGRFVLQSFSPESIVKLEKYLPNIPKCFLLWHPELKDELKSKYHKAITFAIENNVHFIGPSIAGAPNNYAELTAPWMIELVHQSGLYIHPYTFDTEEQLNKYASGVEGVFTNRADLALKFYYRLGEKTAIEILDELGY